MLTILTIDFEASCLPRHGRSFPIEVGVAGATTVHSWLIRPSAAWDGWDWTAEAQGLHGLNRERIERDGQSVETVLDELTEIVGRARVIADSMIDQYWLDTLAAAAGKTAPFAIDHITQLLDERGVGERAIGAAVAYADAHYPVRHRAACDAQWLHAVAAHAMGDIVPARTFMAESLC